MPINKSRGNMYTWVTHTHAHLYGRCAYRCSYCYAMRVRGWDPRLAGKNGNKTYLSERELEANYNGCLVNGKIVPRVYFIDHMNDLFSPGVSPRWINAVLEHTRSYPAHTYVFQTKNPERANRYLSVFPPNRMIGTTIETNRNMSAFSCAPSAAERIKGIRSIGFYNETFVTIEPIMDFDLLALATIIVDIRPTFVTIGADSKGTGLPEPSAEKVIDLIDILKMKKIPIRDKHNLGRILGNRKEAW